MFAEGLYEVTPNCSYSITEINLKVNNFRLGFIDFSGAIGQGGAERKFGHEKARTC
jgi:hypothetical protein